jgi:asparagine synthase (glutamine-hydrolysing)
MCAIGGWIGGEVGQIEKMHLSAMMDAMQHRGPDDAGTWIDKNGRIGLGHNRLSIIDLSNAGHQPMVNDANGDVLSFNGEIYNFRDLRRDLEAKGFQFRSRSDTEVLLYALAAWGMDCLSRIEGMYAFALWRPSENALYLARDPLGIKPLYYSCCSSGRGLAFASEIKAFFALPGFNARLNRRALSQFLEFGYTFSSDHTCLEGVQKLPPGHVLKVRLDEPSESPKAFYQPRVQVDEAEPAEDREEELYETLSLVVRQHLNADVPVGLLLSGGLDSSILASLAARTARVKTISMGFAGSALDERPHARRVAEHIGSDHEEILLSPDDIKNSLSDGIMAFDDLFADWGTISTRVLYAKCRERGVKVVIVGEGSDELFGGYDIFRQSFSKAPTELWLFQLYRRYAGKRYGQCYRDFRAVMRKHLIASDGDRFASIRLFETRQQLPNNYVMKVDKASMSVSVEARVPFLDRRIADIAFRTPSAELVSRNSEKLILRRMAKRFDLLPPDTISRRKVGGSIATSWMDDDPSWRNYAQEIILDSESWTKELGLLPAMNAYFIGNRSGYRFPHSISIFRNLAWKLLILELWARAYKVTPSVV